MEITTNLRKMRTSLTGEMARYRLPLVHILEQEGEQDMADWIGHRVSIQFGGEIHCVVTGKKIRKTFGEGMSYDAFMTSPLACPSIIRPELSRIHEGIALRDKEWEEAHHLQPHDVYLSLTSDVKVGVTRSVNVPSRWIDQGASEAIIIAKTPYRQLAGLIEVALKPHLPDKTNWQKMLKNEQSGHAPLPEMKDRVLAILPSGYEPFFWDNDDLTHIKYPVLTDPAKVKSVKLDSAPEIAGTLTGIKGQYLIFDDGRVFNVRSHAGYRVTFRIGEQDTDN
jgi:hypothetical protein